MTPDPKPLSAEEIERLRKQLYTQSWAAHYDIDRLCDMAARTARLETALKKIAEAHTPDQPASSGVDEATHVYQHVAHLRRIALTALNDDPGRPVPPHGSGP